MGGSRGGQAARSRRGRHDEFKAYSQKYPGLEVQWDGDALVFDGDLKHQWSILRLLDEAGFTGELSGDPFLSKNKDPL
jgi:hypothetical protein